MAKGQAESEIKPHPGFGARGLFWSVVLGSCLGVSGCDNAVGKIVGQSPSPLQTSKSIAALPSDIFATLKDSVAAHNELCSNGADGLHPSFPDDGDAVTGSFCQDFKPGGVMPTPHNLKELQRQVGLEFKNPSGGNGVDGNPGFALSGHSSSLVSHSTSSINPRAFIFTPPPTDGSKPTGYAIITFIRGEQFVEVAVHDVPSDTINLYVVRFDQACTNAKDGCSNADLLTPSLETGWQNVRVYESSTSLNNTIVDCLQCHQPDASGGIILRMQELTAPYTHFFSNATAGGQALLTDFHRVHGHNEDYGGIPAGLIDKSDPAKLAALITAAGHGTQPNPFDSAAIEKEVQASAPGQPSVNMPIGKSTTWQTAYDAASAGGFIPVPYHDVKVTDPTKLEAMAQIYSQVMANQRPPGELPDIRDVFLDNAMPDMTFQPKPGLTGRQLLVQVCQHCHNAKLDQTTSRANFRVDQLDTMSRLEKQKAIGRLGMPDDSRLHMPPAIFHSLSASERTLIVQELSK